MQAYAKLLNQLCVCVSAQPVLNLRLCGIGVALSAEAETGRFRTDHVCRKGEETCEKILSRRDLNPCTQDLEVVALHLSHGL